MNKLLIFLIPIMLNLSCSERKGITTDKQEEKISYTDLKVKVEEEKKSFHSKLFNRTEIKNYLFQLLKNDILPKWEGTDWDFNGTTTVPNQGSIACGYFIMTVLEDAGFICDRIKFSQQASSKIIYSFCDKKDIKIFGNKSFDDFYKFLLPFEDEIFIVGMDNHVGFVINEGGVLYAVHSSSYPQGKVVKEFLRSSKVFQDSKVHYVGQLFNRKTILKKWKNSEMIILIN